MERKEFNIKEFNTKATKDKEERLNTKEYEEKEISTTTPAEVSCPECGHDLSRRTISEEPPLENAGRARDMHCGAGVHVGRKEQK
jgi:hypothetical protein